MFACVDFILFLANSIISTQYFRQFGAFSIIGIMQNSVIWFLANSIPTQYLQEFDTFCVSSGFRLCKIQLFDLAYIQTDWLTSVWNAECRENKIWLERVMKLIEKKKF